MRRTGAGSRTAHPAKAPAARRRRARRGGGRRLPRRWVRRRGPSRGNAGAGLDPAAAGEAERIRRRREPRADSRAGRDPPALLERDRLEERDRPEDLLDRDRAQMPQPEDLAGELALAAREDDAVSLDRAVERLPGVPLWELRRSHRLRRVALVGEQLEPQRLEAGPRRRRAGLVGGADTTPARHSAATP